ncbi:serine/threonine-protein kinase [Streptomyces rubiginosohelvolus]|uniref:Serine/threonine-protein kinase n=1 Tax=Streptomyces rubiginosohelvolus TaxID=67362 RepID=A0ABW6EVZ3_9ACTN
MSSASSTDPFQPLKADDPAVVGGYRLAAVLGAGGMGKVYLSYTPGGRPLAIKVIRAEFGEDPEFRRRFQQEVRSAQRVQGLYTAPVIDSDTEGAQPWLATAYVPGPSLAHAVARHGGLPLRSVLLLTVGVAEALGVIHGAGIVHRDLKPANVLLAADGPRVIDFGIARAADTTALTGTGVSVGTPAFMAPEQAAAGTVTPATDVFALGQIAAYAAIGAPAFGEGPSHAVLYRIVHEDPDLSRLPDELRPLVSRCLSRDPADRPALADIIRMCHEISPEPLRQGEDWLPQEVAGSITERLRMPAPAPTPPPQPSTAPTPTEFAPQSPVPGSPYTPTEHVIAAAPTQTGPAAGSPPAPPGTPAYPATPHGPNSPSHNAIYRPSSGVPQRDKPRRTGLIVTVSVVGAIVVLGVLGSLLRNFAGQDDKDPSAGNGKDGSSASSGGGEGGGQQKAPTPVSYKGIDIPEGYFVMLADNPPRPDRSGNGRSSSEADLHFQPKRLNVVDSDELRTRNGKLILLNGGQKGSLETCRTATRYTEEIPLDQLTEGSQICVISNAGHIALAVYRGASGSGDPSAYVSLDLTVWRNTAEPVK